MLGRHMGLDLYRKRELGTCHGDDIFYLFPMGMPGLPKAIKTPRDLHVSQTIVDFFAQFATSGSPGWDLYTSASQEMNKFQVIPNKAGFPSLLIPASYLLSGSYKGSSLKTQKVKSTAGESKRIKANHYNVPTQRLLCHPQLMCVLPEIIVTCQKSTRLRCARMDSVIPGDFYWPRPELGNGHEQRFSNHSLL